MHNLDKDEWYDEIQQAIDDADDGDTLLVYPGEYEENVDIDKSITLLGPNKNISPNPGGRVDEAVISPTSGTVFSDAADDIEVIIKGFKVAPDDYFNNRFLRLSNDNVKWTMEKNIFMAHGAQAEKGHFYIRDGDDWHFTFHDNYVTDYYSNGLRIFTGDDQNIEITDNVWEDYTGWALNINRVIGEISGNVMRNSVDFGGIVLATSNNDVIIESNIFENLGAGIDIHSNFTGTADVKDNDFIDNHLFYVRDQTGAEDLNAILGSNFFDPEAEIGTFAGNPAVLPK